jgi:hypothetical protein
MAASSSRLSATSAAGWPSSITVCITPWTALTNAVGTVSEVKQSACELD